MRAGETGLKSWIAAMGGKCVEEMVPTSFMHGLPAKNDEPMGPIIPMPGNPSMTIGFLSLIFSNSLISTIISASPNRFALSFQLAQAVIRLLRRARG